MYSTMCIDCIEMKQNENIRQNSDMENEASNAETRILRNGDQTRNQLLHQTQNVQKQFLKGEPLQWKSC